MNSSWTPDVASLQQLANIFAGTLSSDTNTRLEATNALTQAKSIPDFDNYLLHILLANEIDDSTRASAGIYLKNDLMKNFKYKASELQSHILELLPHGLLSESPFVRHITSGIISAVFRTVGTQGWPSVIPDLISLITGAAGINAIDGSSEALVSIAEDSARLLEQEVTNLRDNTKIIPIQLLVPSLIGVISNDSISAKVKSRCLTCLVYFINVGSLTIKSHIDSILNIVFQLCQQQTQTSANEDVQKQIAAIFVGILEQWPEKLFEQWQGIVSWITHMVQSTDDAVALQADEFLLSMSTSQLPADMIVPYLGAIIPVLLEKMVYDESDVELMEAEDAKDDGSEDKDEDIKPLMAKSKEHKLNKKEGADDNKDNSHANNNDSDDDSDDDDDEDDDDFDNTYTWNLRKCSAATVDTLSSSYPVEVLQIAFPIIKMNMDQTQWPVREASILTLGAISEAALEHAQEQLPELIPFLVDRIKDEQPRVRQIACWTLSRYSMWVCSEATTGGAFANYFKPTFQAIMDCALDKKKVVQESACSSLSDFIECSEPELISQFTEPLLHHFQAYFATYRRKNVIVLYDTVQTFVDKVGEELRYNPAFIDLLLPPLIQKWQTLSDNDKDLWPLLECMSSVAAAIGEAFANCAVPVYERGVSILHNGIEQDKLANSDPSFIAPEKDFIVTALDLVDGLLQGFTAKLGPLITETDAKNSYSLMEMVLTCLDDNFYDVRQSAYALIGDCAIYLYDLLIKPYIQTIMVSIYQEITCLNPDTIASCNNAIWSLGEIAIRANDNLLDQYLANFLKVLEPLIHDINADVTLLENTAVTIGRFGIHYPDQTAYVAQEVMIMWCELITGLEDNEEKSNAVTGMCNIIMKHPDIANDIGNVRSIIDLIARYNEPGAELAGTFKVLLEGFKSGLGSDWERIVSDSQEGLELRHRYGV